MSTVSQCPLLMSEVKLSMESTVFRVIPGEGLYYLNLLSEDGFLKHINYDIILCI